MQVITKSRIEGLYDHSYIEKGQRCTIEKIDTDSSDLNVLVDGMYWTNHKNLRKVKP